MADRKREIDQVEAQWRIAQAYARLFATPDGQVVLADLEQEFDHNNPLLGGRHSRTYANIGSLQVIRAIRSKIQLGRLTPKEFAALQPATAQTEPETKETA